MGRRPIDHHVTLLLLSGRTFSRPISPPTRVYPPSPQPSCRRAAAMNRDRLQACVAVYRRAMRTRVGHTGRPAGAASLARPPGTKLRPTKCRHQTLGLGKASCPRLVHSNYPIRPHPAFAKMHLLTAGQGNLRLPCACPPWNLPAIASRPALCTRRSRNPCPQLAKLACFSTLWVSGLHIPMHSCT